MAVKATLVRPDETGARWLQDQATKIHERYGRHVGRGPLLEGIVNAFAELKIDFGDCASSPEVTVKTMRLIRPWMLGSGAKEGK